MTDDGFSGTVIESFGRHVVVAAPGRDAASCKLRGRKLTIAVGDLVRVAGATAGDWAVVERMPRRNVLARSDSRGLPEDMAANLDQLGVVIAPEPVCDPFIVDRYLAGAAFAGIPAFLVVNKADMADASPLALDAFTAAGVRIARVSARTGLGLDDLKQQLEGRRTLLAGQSGVGKSTLFNVLSGGTYRATRTLSTGSLEGRHTTVSSAIVVMPWGELVDSPGVRDYAPPLVPLREVQTGFAEISTLSASCRFLDCLHSREPDCAVRAAVASGGVDERRYESYRRLLNLTRQLDERRGYRS
jgi:ribosome biogenesis GTPase